MIDKSHPVRIGKTSSRAAPRATCSPSPWREGRPIRTQPKFSGLNRRHELLICLLFIISDPKGRGWMVLYKAPRPFLVMDHMDESKLGKFPFHKSCACPSPRTCTVAFLYPADSNNPLLYLKMASPEEGHFCFISRMDLVFLHWEL